MFTYLVFQNLGCSGPAGRIDRQAFRHKAFCSLRYIRPVFSRLELVIACDDGFRFEALGIPIEGRVACQQEVRDHTHRPDIYWFPMSGCKQRRR